ncbi:VOC family protein [Altericroceibacterium endophyticum]|uniref:VOC domain-containing protein n=1 Tax=Altericroceibacterium endophyticum TaxID=1808508 RepID=A0A6I4T949_9SPHN|nr:VOC family protein [Altericroceibacterium endophyticum]MXO66661.1 hypothetical protein [Altericroceibacterium endophyticum]
MSAALMPAAAAHAADEAEIGSESDQSAAAYFEQDFMNVFRRFLPDKTQEMVNFYTQVLGLKPLQPIQLNAEQTIILLGIGDSQIKLAAGHMEGRKYHLGGVGAATGIRYFTLFFPDAETLTQRFEEAGYAAPQFTPIGGGKQAAFVADPAGFMLKLVIWSDADPAQYGKVRIGINASHLAESRAFYRDFVGLEQESAELSPLLETMIYPYRHGATTLELFSIGHDLPADTGSAGIQYVVRDAAAVDALGKQRKITVETPLGKLPNFDLTFVWLNDPDGVTNYFAQIGPARPKGADAPGPWQRTTPDQTRP